MVGVAASIAASRIAGPIASPPAPLPGLRHFDCLPSRWCMQRRDACATKRWTIRTPRRPRFKYWHVSGLAGIMPGMKSRTFSLIGVAILAVVLSCAWSTAPSRARPNVILFLADDLGAAELGCYGNREHRTPNLDRLAGRGLAAGHVLRDAAVHAHPRVPDDRAVRVSQRLSRHAERGVLPAPDSPQRAIGNHFTIGDLMKSAGYATALAGKWQLPGEIPDADPRLRLRRVPDVGLQAQPAQGRRAHRPLGGRRADQDRPLLASLHCRERQVPAHQAGRLRPGPVHGLRRGFRSPPQGRSRSSSITRPC